MKLLIIGALPRDDKKKELYEQLIDTLKDKFKEIHSPIDTLNFEGNVQERYARALKLIKKADVVIAEASSPSTGQGIEINEALNLNKKVIVIARKESNVSGLILGCPKIKDIFHYGKIEDLNEKLGDLL